MTILAADAVLFSDTDTTGSTLRIARGFVEWDGTLISNVGEGDPPAGATYLPHTLLAPALVNSHTHSSLTVLRGATGDSARGNMVESLFYRVERHLTAEDVRAFTRMGAWESLFSGVGVLWEHYFFGTAVAQGLRDVGITGVVAPTLQDLAGPGVPLLEQAWAETFTLAGDNVYAAFGPHATDTVSKELWQRVGDAARKNNLPLHAHLAQSIEEVRRARETHNATPFEILERSNVLTNTTSLFAHNLFVSEAELRRLPSTAHLVLCPYSQMVFGFPARANLWQENHVDWFVATDCAASNDSMSLRKELRWVRGEAGLRTSLSNEYASYLRGQGSAEAVAAFRDTAHNEVSHTSSNLLARVTSNAGQIHPQFRAGAFVPGALANIVAYNLKHPSFWPGDSLLDALVMNDVDTAIHSVWNAGRQIGELGNFQESILRSEEYRAHVEEATRRRSELLERAVR